LKKFAAMPSCCEKRLSDLSRDLACVLVENEVTGIEPNQFRARKVAQIGICPRRYEERIILSPDDQGSGWAFAGASAIVAGVGMSDIFKLLAWVDGLISGWVGIKASTSGKYPVVSGIFLPYFGRLHGPA